MGAQIKNVTKTPYTKNVILFNPSCKPQKHLLNYQHYINLTNREPFMVLGEWGSLVGLDNKVMVQLVIYLSC